MGGIKFTRLTADRFRMEIHNNDGELCFRYESDLGIGDTLTGSTSIVGKFSSAQTYQPCPTCGWFLGHAPDCKGERR